MRNDSAVPVVDVFAGPGGLGEGFASFISGGEPAFEDVLSIEADAAAHRTLELRSWFRSFGRAKVPASYYAHLRGELSRAELFEQYPSATEEARRRAWRAELGRITQRSVYERVAEALGDSTRPWVLVGGPPCQAYSSAGRSRRVNDPDFGSDEKHTLYREYLKILARFKPAVFVLENVKGLLSATLHDVSTFDRIRRDLEKPASAMRLKGAARDSGYELFPAATHDAAQQGLMFKGRDLSPSEFIVRSEDFGIPQRRHRVFLIGVRRDLGTAPRPLRDATSTSRAVDVLSDLPPIRSGLTDRPDTPSEWASCLRSAVSRGGCLNGTVRHRALRNRIRDCVDQAIETTVTRGHGGEFVSSRRKVNQPLREWLADDRLGGVCNHTARRHLGLDLCRYMFVSAYGSEFGVSPKLRDFPDDLLPDHLNVKACRDRRYDFADRFRVQLATEPATTVVSHIAKDGHYYIHYDPVQCRSLTVREAARLQTFPDNYLFCGNRTQQYKQVGNAVPPLLALRIAEQVHSLLSDCGVIASKIQAG